MSATQWIKHAYALGRASSILVSFGRPLVALCAVLLLAACATPQERFYTLSPTEAALGAPRPRTELPRYSVALGPVTIPDLVDRPQIVVRRNDNRVDILELHRWGQSLRGDIARVLAVNLAIDLAATSTGGYVLSSAESLRQDANYHVAIDIRQFEALAGDAVRVQAVWTVRPSETPNHAKLLPYQTTVSEPISDSDPAAIAAGFSKALSVLSAQISKSVIQVQSLQKN